MRVLILLQSVEHLGGTNVQLNRVAEAMKRKNIIVDNEALHKSYDLIILPTSEIKRVALILKEVDIKKVLIWALGYGAFFGSFIPIKVRNKLLSKSIAIIAKSLAFRNVLYFSDICGMKRDVGDISGLSDALIIPISIDIKSNNVIKPPIYRSSKKKFIWLGRLSYDFKFLALKKIIANLNEIAKDCQLDYSLDVVGDGEASEELQYTASKCEWLDVNFRGEMSLQSFENLVLTNHYEAILSMGTSVLEGARLGLNSIIVMPMMNLEDYQREASYRLVYDTIGFSMGEFSDDEIQKNYPLIVALNKLTNSTGAECKKYAENFSVDIICESLMTSGGSPGFSVKIFFYVAYLFHKLKEEIKFG